MRIVTELRIDAPPEEVWAALSDLSTYPSWNPFTPKITGRLEVGTNVRLHVVLGGRKLVRSHQVSALDPPTRLCWTIITPMAWLIRGERCQSVEPHPDGGCVYRNDEQVHGLVGPMVGAFFASMIRAGLDEASAGLKAYVEGTSGAG